MTVSSVEGEGCSRSASRHDEIFAVIHRAIKAGFVRGRRVKIGVVQGTIIGYNISTSGLYRFNHFPLLVSTELGVTKFGTSDVMLA